MSLRFFCGAAVAAWALAPAVAAGGGLGRPNLISARGVGMGGAFTAVADDPSALHFNPGGAAWADEAIVLGAELVYAPRSYVPIDARGDRGASEDAKPFAPVPVMGVLIRPDDADGVPSRLTLGVGLWNTYGGSLEYERGPEGVSAVNATTDLVIELVTGVGYEVSDRLAIGAAVRLGIGIFHVDATAHPSDTDLSANGLGVGVSFGALFRPVDSVSIGVAWRSPLTIQTKGSGTLDLGEPTEVDTEHEQPWPQAASLGLAVRVASPLRLSAQVDWTGWSRWEVIKIYFPAMRDLDQNLPLDWSDNVSARLGAEYRAGPGLVVRAGGYFDSNAVPDRTIERIYLDGQKFGLSAGSSIGLGKSWRIDLAADVTLPNSRVVPDNGADVPGGWVSRENAFPGEHGGSLYTLEVAFARRL